MEKIQLEAQKRDGTGKGVARALRREKRIPAVIYGDGKEPVLIALESKEVFKALHSGGFFTQVCDIDIGGTKHLVLARDVQLHPVNDQPMHADFMRVTEKTKIWANVPVQFINEDKSPGLERGGLLNTIMHEIELYCQATKIPEAVIIDLEGLDIGDSVPFSAVQIPDGVEAALEDDTTVASVTAPAAVRSAGKDEDGEEIEGEEGAEGAEGETAEGDGESESGEDAENKS
ncbi:MAG: 50S ribosomal protein L25/general stress protein Ctc [Micavibrio sp.]|jgi:large subunit ribosomal protein L25|nr:MAG: 50S ribosomal protein L25/general stress protein Ctc [Micavibrio sp.]